MAALVADPVRDIGECEALELEALGDRDMIRMPPELIGDVAGLLVDGAAKAFPAYTGNRFGAPGCTEGIGGLLDSESPAVPATSIGTVDASDEGC